jgi:allantoinase
MPRIAGLQLGLRATWTDARARGFDLATVTRWMCEQPATLAGLDRRKGRLARGYDADLVIWHPDRAFTVQGASLEHRHDVTPYAGQRLSGEVELTILRGRTIYERASGVAAPSGELLRRA